MNKEELILELKLLGIKEANYSLNEGLKINAYIIESLDGVWRFFYFDEKGNETSIMLLKSKTEAYNYLLDKVKEDIEFYN